MQKIIKGILIMWMFMSMLIGMHMIGEYLNYYIGILFVTICYQTMDGIYEIKIKKEMNLKKYLQIEIPNSIKFLIVAFIFIYLRWE